MGTVHASEAEGGPSRRAAVAVLAALLAAFLATTGARALNVPDEGRYAEVAREMLRLGDFVTPRLDGVPFLDKPPLFYWLEAASFALFGVHVWSARLVPALLGFAGCAMVYAAAARLRGRRAGILAALALAANPYYFGASQYVNHDLAVATWITAAVLAFAAGERAEGSSRRRWLWAGYAAMGLGVLTKGLIGVVLPLGIVGIWIVATGRWREIRRYQLPSGLLLTAAIAVPWHLVAEARNPGLLHHLIVVQHFQRFVGSGFNNPAGPLFFPAVIALGLLPWTPLLPSALRRAWGSFRRDRQSGGTDLLLLVWPALVVVFFSIPHSKIAGYTLPAVPPLALLVGLELDARLTRAPAGRPWALGVSAALMALIGAGLAAAPLVPALRGLPFGAAAALVAGGAVALAAGAVVFAERRGRLSFVAGAHVAFAAALFAAALPALPFFLRDSTEPLAAALAPRLGPGDLVVSYRRYFYDLPIFLDRTEPIVVAEPWSDPDIPRRDDWRRDLWFGREREPASRAWLVEPGELAARCRAVRCFVVTRERDRAEVEARLPLAPIAAANGMVLLATSAPVVAAPRPVLSVPAAAGRAGR